MPKGQIVVTISSTKTYNYLNGFTLTESFASTVPAMDNSITIQKKGETIVEGGDLQVSAYPNPAPKAFTLQLRSSNAHRYRYVYLMRQDVWWKQDKT
jgi:hypothetical protein